MTRPAVASCCASSQPIGDVRGLSLLLTGASASSLHRNRCRHHLFHKSEEGDGQNDFLVRFFVVGFLSKSGSIGNILSDWLVLASPPSAQRYSQGAALLGRLMCGARAPLRSRPQVFGYTKISYYYFSLPVILSSSIFYF